MRKYILTIAILLSLPLTSSAYELSLYGGDNYSVFLGCINCSEYSLESICNKSNKYGNRYSLLSISNKQGKYGNKHLPDSPWNANRLPKSTFVAIIGENNTFHGYFTIKTFVPRKSSITDDLAKKYKELDGDLVAIQDMLCDDTTELANLLYRFRFKELD